jgi:hypothetical protein
MLIPVGKQPFVRRKCLDGMHDIFLDLGRKLPLGVGNAFLGVIF